MLTDDYEDQPSLSLKMTKVQPESATFLIYSFASRSLPLLPQEVIELRSVYDASHLLQQDRKNPQ